MSKYRIQVNFGTGRTVAGPNKGVITFWRSGAKLHGGGDEKVMLCQEVDYGSSEFADFKVGKNTSRGGCGAFIEGSFIRGGIAYCPKCLRMMRADRVTGEVYFRSTSADLASGLAKYFRLFEHNADLVIKYAEDDIRYKVVQQLAGPAEARRLRGMLVYPLHRLLKDTASGSTVESRFLAAVSA
jgi:hypothetical protein